MPTTYSADKILGLIESLSPGNKLRLAADLIEAGQRDFAEAIADGVVTELTAIRLFPDLLKKRT